MRCIFGKFRMSMKIPFLLAVNLGILCRKTAMMSDGARIVLDQEFSIFHAGVEPWQTKTLVLSMVRRRPDEISFPHPFSVARFCSFWRLFLKKILPQRQQWFRWIAEEWTICYVANLSKILFARTHWFSKSSFIYCHSPRTFKWQEQWRYDRSFASRSALQQARCGRNTAHRR